LSALFISKHKIGNKVATYAPAIRRHHCVRHK